MIEISASLDGPKRRDLSFFAGDDQNIDLTVYAHDGDVDALTVTNPRILTQGYPAATIPVETDFVVPQTCYGRRQYRLVGDIDGVTYTLCFGVMVTLGGDICIGYDYGWWGYACN